MYAVGAEREMGNQRFVVKQALTEANVLEARRLFEEYADSIDFGLCFQSFGEELARLPGEYAHPAGRLLLLEVDNRAQGCVALRKDGERVCEMKRVYVRPQFRGKGLGRELVNAALREAREMRYTRMRLDSVRETMQTAIALYRRLGFREVEPYRSPPLPGVVYMELDLT